MSTTDLPMDGWVDCHPYTETPIDKTVYDNLSFEEADRMFSYYNSHSGVTSVSMGYDTSNEGRYVVSVRQDPYETDDDALAPTLFLMDDSFDE